MLTADDKSEIILEILQQTFGIEFVREDDPLKYRAELGFTSVDNEYRIFVYANMPCNSKEDYIRKVRKGFEAKKELIKPDRLKCYVLDRFGKIEVVRY
ncbi:hypothetical protein P3573_13335 [Vibrio parahaemolyticus]|uniref:hypothetical protein n=1 Tax=Vibrio TaxID=662 RepID=UPI0004A36ECB|nr:hypothetical protein [Vibrio parahaemolyticus]MBO0152263.1 hypothetical protein [Vibrio parahaemolyticus]MDF4278067.1 hypothetical protein [Vibrio parahaemolyticus]MDF4969560.1 hypothetical protein [Vibrio parahaemolyticus]MDG2547376.1 hypothetical protein [Vibrio parahaemolyticus]MDG2557910.1 hypothetical protein [Vibrio parahaemolyticus]